MLSVLVLPQTSWPNLGFYLAFWVIGTTLVSSFGLTLGWFPVVGAATGRKLMGRGLAGGLVIGSLLTALAHSIAVQTIPPINPEASNIVSGYRVYQVLRPVAIAAALIGSQGVIGLNVLLVAQLRTAAITQINSILAGGGQLHPHGVGKLGHFLSWWGLVSLVWLLWTWLLFPGDSTILWSYVNKALISPGNPNSSIVPDAVYVGAACGALFAMVWQTVWRRSLWPTAETAQSHLTPRVGSVIACAVVVGLLWWGLYWGAQAPLLLWFNQSGARWSLWLYLAMQAAVLGLTTGPLLGLLLQTQPWRWWQRGVIGALWGVVVLLGHTIFRQNLMVQEIAPVIFSLRFGIVVGCVGGLLGSVAWLWYVYGRDRTGSLAIACLSLLVGAMLSRRLITGLGLWPTFSADALQTVFLNPMFTGTEGVWASVQRFSRFLFSGLMWRSLLWGGILGTGLALVGAVLPFSQAPNAANASASLLHPFANLGRLLSQPWPNHPKLWRWMGVWSGGWLMIILLLNPWQMPLVLWPNILLYSFGGGKIANRDGLLSMLGLLETAIIATCVGALVGLVWQTTYRRFTLADSLADWQPPGRFAAGVFASAVSGGWLGLGWLSVFFICYRLRFAELGIIADLIITLYFLIHAGLMGWWTALLGHAFAMDREARLTTVIQKSALFMAIACGFWALLQFQYEWWELWRGEYRYYLAAQLAESLAIGRSLVGQVIRGGLIGALVGWVGYQWCQDLPDVPLPSGDNPPASSSAAAISGKATVQGNPVERARQGDPAAIAQLINRQLQTRGVTAKVYRQGDRLQVVLTAESVPPQQLAEFVKTGLRRLQPQSIQRGTVFGKQRGSRSAAWQQPFSLSHQP